MYLSIISQKSKHINFIWTHIGNGPLYENLYKMAHERLSCISNVDFNFTGQLKNSDVLEFYKKNNIDVFLNCKSI